MPLAVPRFHLPVPPWDHTTSELRRVTPPRSFSYTTAALPAAKILFAERRVSRTPEASLGGGGETAALTREGLNLPRGLPTKVSTVDCLGHLLTAAIRLPYCWKQIGPW